MTATCQATTKAGEACKRPPLPDNDFCAIHQPPEPEPGAVCGHTNAHYLGDKPLTCDRPPGHTGAHSAVYHTTDYRDGGIVFEGEKRTYWLDAAGTPVDP